MSTILSSIRGLAAGIDASGYFTTPTGIKTPALYVGTSGSEVGPIADPTVAAGTTTGLSNTGISTLSTATSATYPLDAPFAGARKVITTLAVATATTRIVSATAAGATFDGTNNLAIATSKATLELVGLSTTRWAIISNYAPATTSAFALSTA